MADKYDNSGALYVNDRKQKDSHPDRSGKATIDGVEYYVSAWIKESKKDGSKFLSLAFKRVDEARRSGGGGGGDRDRRDDRGYDDRRDDRGRDRDDRRDSARPPARKYDDAPF